MRVFEEKKKKCEGESGSLNARVGAWSARTLKVLTLGGWR